MSRVMASFLYGQLGIPEAAQNIPTTARLFLFHSLHAFLPIPTMSLATKTQSQNIFTKLKAKPANKVRCFASEGRLTVANRPP